MSIMISSSNNPNKKPFQEELKLRLYEIVDNGFFVADHTLKTRNCWNCYRFHHNAKFIIDD